MAQLDIMTVVIILHAVSTIALFGLIWFVQLVHYPLFLHVGPNAFVGYEARHQRRTTFIVLPLMGVEAVTSLLLVIFPPDANLQWLTWSGWGLVVLIWLSTFLIQVPLHRKLERGPDSETVGKLVGSNWIRTVCWTLRVPIALALLIGP